jgi:hypothetical protein
MGTMIQWNVPALTTGVIRLEVEFQMPNADPNPRDTQVRSSETSVDGLDIAHSTLQPRCPIE